MDYETFVDLCGSLFELGLLLLGIFFAILRIIIICWVIITFLRLIVPIFIISVFSPSFGITCFKTVVDLFKKG